MINCDRHVAQRMLRMPPVNAIFVFCSTPDVVQEQFVVPILAEPVDRLAERAAVFGFDGLEFLPGADQIPQASSLQAAVDAAGICVGVVNSGRLRAKGYALLHKDEVIRRKSIDVFKGLIGLAGGVGARVGLGLARGDSETTLAGPDLPGVMRDVFGEIGEYARQNGTIVMLEPADPGFVAAILRVREAASAAREIDNPGFQIMLDTYQLHEVEDTIPEGFAAADGLASHIHLYDPHHWSPGIRPKAEQMDWALIRKSMDETGFSGSGSIVLPKEGDVDKGARDSIAFLRRTLMDR